ncbi:hypothetical protein ACHAXA_003279 [Cyclostephanos tholiformis]|uniref:Uncharacterized protein n=1 Tax=Cyclostephanos tholiformis TaxID=382380 RepID=A0ABD3RSU0_9STRA
MTTGHQVDRFDGGKKKKKIATAGAFRCTSQVESDVRGRGVTIDRAHDSRGNGHRSSAGRARTEYISRRCSWIRTIAGGSSVAAIAPVGRGRGDDVYVPARAHGQVDVEWGERGSIVEEALNFRRPSNPGRRGSRQVSTRTTREVETITPLSNKFRLDVDERFGVGDEGDLARDYFVELGDSVN